jgi:elongation of very long chain fatty acids protein 6
MSYAQGGGVSFWCFAFVVSKYAELLDTVFLVLRKKPVPLLHWYHHATVSVLSIHSMAVLGPTGVIMAAMNSIVHSVMYTYYFLAAIMNRPPSWGKIVTKLQIAQMILGTVMAGAVFAVALYVENAYGDLSNNLMIGIIYVSYLALFVQYYQRRYRVSRVADKEM